MNRTPTGLSRRNLLKLGAGGALATFLGACAGGAEAPGAKGKSGKLTVWAGFASKEAEDWYRANVLEAFNKKYPNVPADLVIKQFDTMAQQQQTALAAGAGPDIVGGSGPAALREYAAAGYLLPLDDYAKKLGWNDRVLGWAMKTGVVDGKLVALPTNYESMQIFYNPATLAKHGWTYPKNRAEFEAICREAKGKGIIPVSAGNADYKDSNEWHVSVFLNHIAGPDAVRQALKGEAKFSDPVFVDAIEQARGYFTQGWWGGAVDRYFTNTFPQQYQQVAKGEAVFNITGTWGLGEIGPFFGKEGGNDAEWAWGAIPSLRDGVPENIWELAVGGTRSINAKSANPDAAADFMDFHLQDPKLQGRALAEANFAPPPIAMSESDFPADLDERVSSLYAAFGDAAQVGYTTWTFFPPKTDTFIIEGWEKLITGKLTSQQYCQQIADTFGPELAAGVVPPLPE
ncbi:ABC transporter substrate-binding protein [Asanoa iriomotensis]|uniref:ABC transporter substrate-binding protein n=1 Tax=Asanoa iriomotensis TaxID=234613 RepID=A0ABQ4BZX8_9ACTN|nr:substrate-binding domain-containing protein [Asanoa iriomotensis]GIF56098.1 ABC transporter substrate-binding protein [Asanoa iriomotensis]